ncbi:hypothetical protein E0D83_15925 [Klebsiella grimontii]|nr:hypothetical protein E0D83_15925 [Klebsiella grimontii]
MAYSADNLLMTYKLSSVPVSDVVACTHAPLRFSLQVGERVMPLVELSPIRLLSPLALFIDGENP